MNDLREAIDGFFETGVEAVDEDENPAPGNPPDPLVEVCLRLRQVDAVGPQDDEIALRIAGDRGRQRNVAGPARAVRRDGHDNVGEIEPAPSRSAEHDAGGEMTGARVVATVRSTRLASGAPATGTRVPKGRLAQPAAIVVSAIAKKTPTRDRRARGPLTGARRARHMRTPSPSPIT